MNTMVFKVFRCNPAENSTSFFREYTVDVARGATVLDVLNQIKWTQDGTLTYRMSCRSAICGSCAVRVNGRSMLACNTQVSDIRTGANNVLIEPLQNMPVIKDLVVDMEAFWEHVEQVAPWLKPAIEDVDPLKERCQHSDDFHRIDDSANCIMCGSCYSDCTVAEVDKEFRGPTALAKAQRFVEDSRDGATKERVRSLAEKHGMWDCTHCFECIEACPKGVKPLEQIVRLRTVSMKEGVRNNNGARHAIGFYEIVRKSGILDENKLPMRSINPLNVKDLFGLLPIGMRMIAKGKMPPIIHKPIEKHTEIQEIYKKLEKK